MCLTPLKKVAIKIHYVRISDKWDSHRCVKKDLISNLSNFYRICSSENDLKYYPIKNLIVILDDVLDEDMISMFESVLKPEEKEKLEK